MVSVGVRGNHADRALWDTVYIRKRREDDLVRGCLLAVPLVGAHDTHIGGRRHPGKPHSTRPIWHTFAVSSPPEGPSAPAEASGSGQGEPGTDAASRLVGVVHVVGLTYPEREHRAAVSFNTADGPQTATVRDPAFPGGQPTVWEGPLMEWLDAVSVALNDWVTYRVYPTADSTSEPVFVDEHIRDDLDPGPREVPADERP